MLIKFIFFCLAIPLLSFQQFDRCNVYGTFYITDRPEEANILVYEEASEAFADILVFEESNRLYADEQGKWFFTESKNLADYIIFFVDDRRDGDLSVYFTNFESFAGCNR